MQLDFDIYNSKNSLKVIVMICILLLAGFSIIYTDRIVSKLEAREEQQIKLYVEALKISLTTEMDTETSPFFGLVIESNKYNSIPTIHKTANGTLTGNNIEGIEDYENEAQQVFLKQKLVEIIKDDHEPFQFDNGFGEKDTIYYGNSKLLSQLRYYPLLQLLAVLTFGFMTYYAFSYSRRSEQNRVWVGMAKETAHQLGTPLSSLTAWIEYFKLNPEKYEPEIISELEKDIYRLDVITTRFSNIGSIPTLKPENISETIEQFLQYLEKRISKKVKITFHNELLEPLNINLNKYLFEWVIENICKNAVDSMQGIGQLNVTIKPKTKKEVHIEIEDTGKGISKLNLRKIFNPGFSTKKRGWGLGLTLAKRIIENYHNGILVVKKSEINKGTIFKITLPV